MSTAPKESCCRVFNSKDYNRVENLRTDALNALYDCDSIQAIKKLGSLIEVVGNFIITPEVTMDVDEAHTVIDWAAHSIQAICTSAQCEKLVKGTYEERYIPSVQYDVIQEVRHGEGLIKSLYTTTMSNA